MGGRRSAAAHCCPTSKAMLTVPNRLTAHTSRSNTTLKGIPIMDTAKTTASRYTMPYPNKPTTPARR
jgi:hypothetical protein